MYANANLNNDSTDINKISYLITIEHKFQDMNLFKVLTEMGKKEK